jgi:hypothetical protein
MYFRPPRYGSFHQQKKEEKNFYCFVTFYDFFSLKNDVKVHLKRNKHKKLIFVCSRTRAGSRARPGSVSQNYGSKDPDPYQNGGSGTLPLGFLV